MWPDVTTLRKFYASRQGKVASRMIRRRVREVWPTLEGKTVAALGYPTPYLHRYRKQTRRLVALMPAEQGVLVWAKNTPNIAVLTEDTLLPLADKSIDRMLVIHGLEFTSHPREMMREVWRVLREGGRMLLVVPNRRGLWARFDKTPFGQGQAYSFSQLMRFLCDNNFAPVHTENALYIPPSPSRLWLSTAAAWEKLGHKWFPYFSGVLLVEVEKQIYAPESVWDTPIPLVKTLAVPLRAR